MQVIEDDLASFESAASPGHLAQYEAIYVLETHLTAAATAGLAKWVRGGGRLFAMAGAGMFDERNKTNVPFAALIGATQTSLYTGTRGLNGAASALLLRGQLGTNLRAPAGTLVHRRGLNLS